MKPIAFIKYMHFYLKAAIRFRYKNYAVAKSLFEKAMQYGSFYENDLFYQYYGQTLLALDHPEEAFIWLKKAYSELEKNGWKASDDENYRLLLGTLSALKYLNENYNMTIDGFSPEKEIHREK